MSRYAKPLRLAVTCATFLLLAALAWQCLDIYIQGNSAANLDANGVHIQNVYRAEDVGARLLRILPGAIVYALLVVAAVSAGSMPEMGKKGMEPDNRIRLMKKRFSQLPEAAQKEELLQKRIWMTVGAVCLAAAVPCGMYLSNVEHFTSWDLEPVMGQMVLHVLPWVLLGFAAVILGSFASRNSMEREIKVLQEETKKGNTKTNAAEKDERIKKGSWKTILRISLYACALLLIMLGIRNGGLLDVLVKASAICTECIGLG